MGSFESRLGSVKERIERACATAGRDSSDITLVAVSKTRPAQAVKEAMAAGVSVFGENKVQEGLEKIEQVGKDRCEWHLIGHLQKNKVRKAVAAFDVIQTVDSVSLAERIDRIAREMGVDGLRVMIQVDLGREETKSGVYVEDLDPVVETINGCSALRLTGLMTIPPYFGDTEKVRPYFRQLADLRARLTEKGVFGGGKGELSMGMSHDFETAIEEGATVIRVGTALFGARN